MNVNDAYAKALGDAIRSIEKLQDIVANFHEIGSPQVNWGHVGTMQHVAAKVKELIDHFEKGK